jgi:hypothetical protein
MRTVRKCTRFELRETRPEGGRHGARRGRHCARAAGRDRRPRQQRRHLRREAVPRRRCLVSVRREVRRQHQFAICDGQGRGRLLDRRRCSRASTSRAEEADHLFLPHHSGRSWREFAELSDSGALSLREVLLPVLQWPPPTAGRARRSMSAPRVARLWLWGSCSTLFRVSAVRPVLIPKCRCGPSVFPPLPSRPSFWPVRTRCPALTLTEPVRGPPRTVSRRRAGRLHRYAYLPPCPACVAYGCPGACNVGADLAGPSD